MMASRRRSKVDKWRNRIVGYGEVDAAEIKRHPNNPHVHPLDQRGAMSAAFDDIGIIDVVIINKVTGNLIDGEMRSDLLEAEGVKVPALFVELTEEEEAKALATIDPIGAMSTYDTVVMEDLVENMPMDAALRAALDGIVAFEDEEEAEEPRTVTLRPLSKAYVLIGVPLDLWDQVADVLDQLDGIEGIDVNSTVK